MKFIDFGFYTVDFEYLKYLYSVDSEVYFSDDYQDATKPFLGIILTVNKLEYFIPLTSVKNKHKKWKNVASEHLLIYEIVNSSKNLEKAIYKDVDNVKQEKKHILSVVDIKKMVPVSEGLYSKIDFASLDKSYLTLINKELIFCKINKSRILNNANKIYNKQMKSGKVHKYYCDFKKLEQAMNDYMKL